MLIRIFSFLKIVLLGLFIIVPATIYSQQKDSVSAIDSSLTSRPKAISLTNIIQSSEEVKEEIKSTERKLVLDNRIRKIDSLFPEYKTFIITEQRKSKNFVRSNPNLEKINKLIIRWNGYQTNLKSWRTTVNQSIKRNLRLLELISFNEQTWSLTYENSISEEVPQETLTSIKNNWEDLINIKNKIIDQKNNLLILEAKIYKQKIIANEVIDELIVLKNSETYNLFYLRNDPLLESLFKTPNETENKDDFKESFSESISKIAEKIITSEAGIHIYLFLIILVVLLILFLKKTFSKYAFNEADGDLQNAKNLFLNHPLSSIVFTSIFIAYFFFDEKPMLFNDLLITLALITSLYLLKPHIYSRFKKTLYFVILLFILDSIKTYIWFSTAQYRVYLLFQVASIILITYLFTKPYLETRKMKMGRFGLLLLNLTPVIYFLAFISLISNILGYTNLTDITIKIIIESITTVVLFYGTLIIFSGIVIGLIHRHFNMKDTYEDDKKLNVEQKSLKIISILVIIYWCRFFLKMTDLLRPLSTSVSDYLSEPYKLGSISFTFGAILTFLLILILSYFATKFISYLFDEDSSLKFLKLPKGVPAAISLIIRYFILVFGIIMALGALNIDLSKFNLMAGALGLGIGFGLQTVISNFVSGLILVFERPILPGDTVEVNNLLGTVNKIGVRSSSISTFDGAEVIVPNNNLIANDLINWTLSDNVKRIEVLVSAAYSSDPNKVLKILIEVANNNKDVLKSPEVRALFSEFGNSSLNFKLRFWVPYELGLIVKSDISLAIYNKFKEQGIEIPFPQQDIYIKEFPEKK
ncbi:mechanosensitive ion channel [Flavobacteriaceae bacterium]|nr:mechanosensitive ion channel [Flavobacteriaceae bacterium]MDB9913828.1 mechanosensitive ion channel [Flavobacteriaceae bacterium]MDB9989618.1 mechanosensitive ion channel [Flavobacteriaceae bacterium]MDB9993187.1 mechanosensitive ion channel [Flavobacteriaceae bacterium]